jgi:ribonuclease HI
LNRRNPSRTKHKIITVGDLTNLIQSMPRHHCNDKITCSCGWCRTTKQDTGCKQPFRCCRRAISALQNIRGNWDPTTPDDETYLSNPSPEEVRNHNANREELDEWLFDPFTKTESITHGFRAFTIADEIDNSPPARAYRQDTLAVETTVYTDGSCSGQGSTEARAGSGIWFGEDDISNISTRVPGKAQSNQVAELYAILLAENLKNWEKIGWIGVSHAKLFRATTTRLQVRFRSAPTKLQWVKGHSGIIGNKEADKLAATGASKNLPRGEIDLSAPGPPGLILSGAELHGMTQKILYKGIKHQKRVEKRRTTSQNLEAIREAVSDNFAFNPEDSAIWQSIRNRDISRNIRDFLWKSVHGALKMGPYWDNIPGHEERALCKECGELETMDHVLARCETPGRSQIWNLMNKLWTKRHDTPFEPRVGAVLGCGLSKYTKDDKPLTGKNRLHKILVSESAFLIWKLRCERAIAGKTHTPTEIHNRWVGTINKRLTEDCLLTDARCFEKKALSIC